LIRGWKVGGDGTPFSRAGALVTAIAVVFIFWEYTKILSERHDLIVGKVRETIAAARFTSKDAVLVLGSIEGDLRSDTEFAKRLITTCQGILLLVGTLVWGFGDITYLNWR